MRIASDAEPHVHRWATRSQHQTSEGAIAYERCVCGQWRVRSGDSHLDQTLALAPTR